MMGPRRKPAAIQRARPRTIVSAVKRVIGAAPMNENVATVQRLRRSYDDALDATVRLCFVPHSRCVGGVSNGQYRSVSASCADLIGSRHQEVFDPNLAAGGVAEPLGEAHGYAAVALQNKRQMPFRAARSRSQFRLADLFVPVHPDGERVLYVHDYDFATGKVSLSSNTLLGGNGHAQR